MKFKFLLFFFYIFLFFTTSFSEEAKKVVIIGNNKISKETILDIIDYRNTKNNIKSIDLNNYQKKLFSSGFFKTVNITFKNGNLLINLLENPIINFFYIEGVINKSRKDYIYNNILLGENKIFSEVSLKSDIQLIKKVYEESGYLDVVINPVLSILKNNSVNLILKIDRKNQYKINKIFFIGDQQFDVSVLKDVVSSSEYKWLNFLSSTDVVSNSRLLYDKSLLKNFYLDQGFREAQITSFNINLVDNYKANIVFSIELGKVFYLDYHKIIDQNKIFNDDQLKKLNIIINENYKETYSRAKILKIKSNIYKFLKKNKITFSDFKIEEKISNNNQISLNFDFYNLDKQFINLVNITGNTITNEDFIRYKLLFSEGDSFLNYELDKSIDNLKNTGIFKNVNPKIINISKDIVDVNINVEEQPTGSISAGVGLSSGESTIGGSIDERNLFGTGIITKTNVVLGTERITGEIKGNIPDFKNSDSDFNFNLFATKFDYTNVGYESSLAGLEISKTSEIFEDFYFTPGFGISSDRISTTDTASSLYQSRKGTYNSGNIFYKVVNDKRDRKFKTTEGYTVSFGQNLAIPGSDIIYVKNSIGGTIYHTILDGFIFKYNGGLNSLNSIDNNDVKLSDRLFLKNTQLRGFDSRGVGPKDGDNFIGGNYSFYSGISSTFPNPIPEKWNANTSIFLDAGNVWGVDFDSDKDSNKIRSSFGLSLDWVSPLGPLNFVLSETLSKASGDNTESFSFQIGTFF